ncbi:hypothetical protein AALO_G00260130 [Alosa alosa]|uniref:Uncharacterized protein n=1 Tax=Alosa alosa TaxID=278164 RepID=A0AAV6FQ32_9TELE|nr:hypothetical protein AALO_G00260130 [Alosa alosa]
MAVAVSNKVQGELGDLDTEMVDQQEQAGTSRAGEGEEHSMVEACSLYSLQHSRPIYVMALVLLNQGISNN